jgi:hypothetical protein
MLFSLMIMSSSKHEIQSSSARCEAGGGGSICMILIRLEFNYTVI